MFDPFKILDLEKQYTLDEKVLEKAYFLAQKKTHPDQFARATAEEKKEASLRSTSVNQAYLVLKDPLKRAEFLLKDQGIECLSHDPTFLGEVMEWRERFEAGEEIREELLEKEKKLFTNLEEAFRNKNYEIIQNVLYQLTYVRKFLKM